jgi:hypothetical protein
VSPPRPCLTTTPGRNLLGPARGTTSPSWSTSPPPRARCPRKGLPLYPRTHRPCTGRFDLRLAQLLHHGFLHLRRRLELFPLRPSIVSLARISIRRGRCLCRLVPSLTLVRHGQNVKGENTFRTEGVDATEEVTHTAVLRDT